MTHRGPLPRAPGSADRRNPPAPAGM